MQSKSLLQGAQFLADKWTRLGHSFPLLIRAQEPRARGYADNESSDALGCGQARRIVSAPCRIRMRQSWSCVSYRSLDPFIVWLRSKELWDRTLGTHIVLLRYPCADAIVDRTLFEQEARGYPSLGQLLADDLIRCKILCGMTFVEVRRLLGPAARASRGRYLSYQLGRARNTAFAIDSELLSVEFGPSGLVSEVSIQQG